LLDENSNFDKLNVFGRQIGISQLADDKVTFLKDQYQIDKAIQFIDLSTKASGLHLNLNKCELFAIHGCKLDSLCNVPIKRSVKYMVMITITRASNQSVQEFFLKIFQKLNLFSITGYKEIYTFLEVLLTKMELLSRFVYPTSLLAVPPHLLKECNIAIFTFIWKNKHHYINKNDLVHSYEEGGLNIIDFEIMNSVLKTQWLKYFLCNPNGL